MYYRSNKIGEDRSYKQAAKAKFKGKDPSKYLNRAKQFMKNAEMQKKMNLNYQKLDERERKRFNESVVAGQYAAQLLGGAVGQSIYQLKLDKVLQNRFG